jgi:hypothetical protein
MSTVAIIVVAVVAVLVLLALTVAGRGFRNRAEIRRRELELRQRRRQVAGEQREEAELRREKATLHEHGMADDELIEDSERERFAGTSAVADREDDQDPGPAA